ATAVEARHEDDVVDEVVEPMAVAIDDLEETLLLVAELAHLPTPQNLQVAEHRRQRGAELVRHAADEKVLQPVELAELLVGARERFGGISFGLEQTGVYDRHRSSICRHPQKLEVVVREHARRERAHMEHPDDLAGHE